MEMTPRWGYRMGRGVMLRSPGGIMRTTKMRRRARPAAWLTAAFGLALLLGACGRTVAAGAAGALDDASATGTAGATGGQGTLTGDVVAGPTCPVERAEDPCRPRPVADREVTIQVQSRAGAATPVRATPVPATVATTKTDANGHFSVRVPPGDYTVRVAIIPGTVGMRQDMPADVSVAAGQTAYIKITLDTGIR